MYNGRHRWTLKVELVVTSMYVQYMHTHFLLELVWNNIDFSIRFVIIMGVHVWPRTSIIQFKGGVGAVSACQGTLAFLGNLVRRHRLQTCIESCQPILGCIAIRLDCGWNSVVVKSKDVHKYSGTWTSRAERLWCWTLTLIVFWSRAEQSILLWGKYRKLRLFRRYQSEIYLELIKWSREAAYQPVPPEIEIEIEIEIECGKRTAFSFLTNAQPSACSMRAHGVHLSPPFLNGVCSQLLTTPESSSRLWWASGLRQVIRVST